MIQPRVRRVAARAGNAALWVTAVLGVVSLLLGLASVVAGVQPLIFRSSSMSPAIDAGALALAKTVPASEVEVDDIISVSNTSGVRVTHRVVEVAADKGDQRSFTLQGDSNSSPDRDPYFAAEVDRVFFDVPYLGYVANWLASPWAMFAAGVIAALLAATLWNRRSRTERSSPAGTGAAVVVAAGLAAAALVPVPRTEAYFSDPSRFTAGAIQAHQVRIFDWDSTPCVDNANGTVSLRSRLASPRYSQVWYLAASGSQPSGTAFHRVAPVGALNSLVTSEISRAQMGSPPVGTYRVVGKSELKGNAPTPWLSSASREVQVTVTNATTVRCGTINLPPSIEFSSPVDGSNFSSTTAADIAVGLACLSLPAPCGTATDANGIYSVEYRLQRSNWLSTQCWTPGGGIVVAGFYWTACGTWRSANTSPGSPNSSTGAVTWRIPVGSSGPQTTFNQSGDYTLYLRVTDNSPTREVTERTIRFTVR